jgi:hypothetical protein
MPRAEHHRLDPGLEWRLKVALNRVTPPSCTPRYLSSALNGVRPWRVAPLALAAATAILLALTATATTGSPNPAVWTGDAASTIGAVRHLPDPSLSPQPSPPPPAPPRKAAVPAQARPPVTRRAAPPIEPTERPEGSPRPRPSASPSPSDDHSGWYWSSRWLSPSTDPGDH